MYQLRQIKLYSILISACALAGWLIGNLDFGRIAQHTADAYLNRFNTMSGATVSEVTYYIVSNQETPLQDVMQISGVKKIKASRINTVFDVVINYEQRREAVSQLRDLPEISAVFTVPFMCH